MGEKFSYYDLGNIESGRIVEITLEGNAANVCLMNSSNFINYKNGKNHKYYGGLAEHSPVRLTIPNYGHWYVVIDFRGLRGSVKHSMRILPKPLPSIPHPTMTEVPLWSVPSLVQHDHIELSGAHGFDVHVREYDVFISHASEDKDEVVRPLASSLKAIGLKVWYDEFELKIGDSLRRKIDRGLATSRFGVVVLSQSFIKKGWTNYELDGLVTKSVTGEQVLLPIWHNISKSEVVEYSPSLADKVARSTVTHTVEEIANEIAEVIRSS
ncbi:MAG TPA: DUF1883 domain-containing protein [Candidatus Competibacter sp.]|nr:DUF1883 domain-containing protein [Candidatus Competibacteraceae bacterium]HPE72748.1 DUF1883 domain-containing protein [Candidatus Competibacter sp.]HRX71731.1 DUF1883 domain-containing protein [Candidatus Competibacteraceae bacterium]